MRGFVVVEEGFEALVEPEEARVLASLAGQLAALLTDAAGDGALSAFDPAVDRLLPDAYRDDEEAAAEWRRLSRRALAERKSAFATRFATDLADAAAASTTTRIRIDEAGALDWVRAIGDLRLVLAERMGFGDDADIDEDDDTNGGADEGDDRDEARAGAADLYQWLAWMQDDLVRVLDMGSGA